MKKWIVVTPREDRFDAGPKAREDTEKIALKNGFMPLPFVGAQTASGSAGAMLALVRDTLRNVRLIRKQASCGDLVVFQYPHYPVKSALLWRFSMPLLQKKGIRFAALVHDLNSVRGLMGWGARYSDKNLLPVFDCVICHHEGMKEYLIRQGLKKEKLVTLRVFDYLAEGDMPPVRPYDKSAVIAGNLSKSGYIPALLAKAHVPLHLFGNGGESLALPEDAIWHGAYPPAALPGYLTGSVGIVWDGDQLNECSGKMGQYLRINAPHKLSLYLAAGLPVIIWNQAGMAAFVEKEQVGWTLSGLDQLPALLESITPETYERMAKNARVTGQKIRDGFYIGQALDKAAKE